MRSRRIYAPNVCIAKTIMRRSFDSRWSLRMTPGNEQTPGAITEQKTTARLRAKLPGRASALPLYPSVTHRTQASPCQGRWLKSLISAGGVVRLLLEAALLCAAGDRCSRAKVCAAVCVQRRRPDGKAHTGHRKRRRCLPNGQTDEV